MNLQTEFEFELPIGFVDGNGVTHKRGRMRLATAYDEIAPLGDARVQKNEAYLPILLLARVITQLGDLSSLSPTIVENLYIADLTYLQALYRQINEDGKTIMTVKCSHCDQQHEIDLMSLGGEAATP